MIAQVVALALLAQSTPDTTAKRETPAPLDCSYGGLIREFGGSEWVVFGCSDRQTIVIYSAKGNPAMPFYFIRYPKDGGFSLYGEGNGDKAFTKPAYDALKAMTAPEWDLLLATLNASRKIET